MSDHDYTQTVSMRLSKAQLELLKHCATEHRVSVSDLIRRWILDLGSAREKPHDLQSWEYVKNPLPNLAEDVSHRFLLTAKRKYCA